MKYAIFLLGACLATSHAWSERYYVEQDSFGNFDAVKADEPSSPKEDGSNPLLDPASEASITPSQSEPALSQEAQSKVPVSETAGTSVYDTPAPVVKQSENVNLQGAVSVFAAQPDGDTSDEGAPESSEATDPVSKPRQLSKFERAYLEAEGQNPYDATRVDDADYVDGDELLKGRAVPENQRPFFITKDLEGNESVTFYSPTLAREKAANAANEIRYSKATIFSGSDALGGSTYQLPESADPLAVKLLSSGRNTLEESYFEVFTRNCCSKLPRTTIKPLFKDRSSLIELSQDQLTYRFSEGDSRYVIVKLPESDENMALEVRAFISKYEAQGIESGVFFPQLVTLDKSFEAVRIISEPILQYTPESWSNYGFLEGVFEIKRENAGEAYVLIHTTKATLNRKSTYEHPTASITLKHMGYGSLGMKVVRAQ